MEKIECSYCKQFSEDPDYCDHCGRELKKKEDSIGTFDLDNEWSEGNLLCDTYLCTNRIKAIPTIPKLIEKPIHIEQQLNEEVKVYYIRTKKQPLSELIKQSSPLSFVQVKRIVRRIATIFKSLREEGWVVGSFDLTDFWGEDFDQFVLRPVRPIYKTNQIPDQSANGDYFAPELYNDRPINEAATVYLIGNLFLTLLLNRNHPFTDYNELRYLSHQLQAFHPSAPFTLHRWLERSTNLSPDKRFTTIQEQLEALNQCFLHYESRTGKRELEEEMRWNFLHYGKTDDGEGKKQKALEQGVDADINEDRYFYQEENGVVFTFIADGISKSHYGSGAKAASHLVDKATSIWDERKDKLDTGQDIIHLLEDVVEKANQAIIDEVKQLLDETEDSSIEPTDVMGSTFVACVIFNGKIYTTSIGDSRIYLYSEADGLQLLHGDENVMNEVIHRGWSWRELDEIENKSSLTRHVGMAEIKDGSIMAITPNLTVKEVNISHDDIIFLCSDGLTDYLHSLGHLGDLWVADEQIATTITKNLKNENEIGEALHQSIDELIDMANKNGGGDNITALAIQVKLENKAQ